MAACTHTDKDICGLYLKVYDAACPQSEGEHAIVTRADVMYIQTKPVANPGQRAAKIVPGLIFLYFKIGIEFHELG